MSFYPSVTEVLKTYQAYNSVPESVLVRAGIRGTAVHEYCSNYAKGILPVNVPEEYMGYVDSFGEWYSNFVDETLFVEERLVDDTLGFSGKPDLVVRGKDKTILLPDLKTGIFGMKLWPLQLAAYKHLLELNDLPIQRTGVLLLNQKPAKLIEYDPKAKHLNYFLQMLNIYKFLNTEGGG